MATGKCRNIYFPKYFMAVRKFKNMYILKYFCTSVNINGKDSRIIIGLKMDGAEASGLYVAVPTGVSTDVSRDIV